MTHLARFFFTVLALAPGMLGAQAASGPPAGAGQLLSQAPLAGAPSGASAWRIRYRSIAEDGVPVEVGGLVIVPAGPPPEGGRHIVAWAHATSGVAEICAPSDHDDRFEQIAGLTEMLRAGDVVTATDYQGLGTPGPSPYLVGVSTGRAVLDSVRAARALPEAGAGTRYAIWGMSQGAHAALWAGQLAPAYMPELQLVGVAAAAPPTDLVEGYDRISNPAVRALMTGYLAQTWSQIYGLDPATFANAGGRLIMDQMAKACVRFDAVTSVTDVGLLVLTGQLPHRIAAPWIDPLARNSVKPVRAPEPLLIAQGGDDSVVIPGVTRSFAEQSCRAGSNLHYLAIAGVGHLATAKRSAGEVTAWIADRFAGRPPVSDCDKLLGGANGR